MLLFITYSADHSESFRTVVTSVKCRCDRFEFGRNIVSGTGAKHYIDFKMGAIAPQITDVSIVYTTVYLDADQRKHSVTGEFPTQMASNAEDVSIWWRHHEC